MDIKFFGRTKVVDTKYGEMIKLSFSEKDFEEAKVNGWVNVILKRSKEGKVYFVRDEWQPDPKMKNDSDAPKVKSKPEPIDNGSQDLPF